MCFYFGTSYGATIAVIDSGTDMLHRDIAPKAWVNPKEIANNDRDEDRNGYQDDVHGWNFAEGNNKVIDYAYLGTLTPDIRKFFEIQAKMIQGTATETEVTWLRTKVEDQEFIKKLSVYGNFMHGTHVSGIAAKDADDAKVMAVKIIPTEVKLPFSLEKETGDITYTLIKFALGQLAKQQMKLLEEVATYVGGHKADVANGSFGTGYKQAKMIVTALYQAAGKEPTPEELHELASYFINTLVREGQHMVAAAPETLFVFAAGNDGMNNDKYPSSPTNVKSLNVISVAASLGRKSLATFSNYGVKMVDVAAPGVAVESTVPGNQYLKVSGTSQAAPYVANIAGQLKDMNKELGPAGIKRILLKTVDIRDYLKDKVKTSGLVNSKRALRAAELSLTMPLSRALEQARAEVEDEIDEKMDEELISVPGQYVLPLPSLFRIN